MNTLNSKDLSLQVPSWRLWVNPFFRHLNQLKNKPGSSLLSMTLVFGCDNEFWPTCDGEFWPTSQVGQAGPPRGAALPVSGSFLPSLS
jgi:hypothetical protein